MRPRSYAYKRRMCCYASYVAVPYTAALLRSGVSLRLPGAYDGGPYVGYWDRLPYACGVYGYC